MAFGRQEIDPELEYSLLSGNDKAAILMSSSVPRYGTTYF